MLDGDFTGDEHRDIVARAPDNTWWLWEGTESGFLYARYFGHWKMRESWMDVAAADFNGDGLDDIVGRSDDGKLWVATAKPNGFHTWTWGDGWVNKADWSQVTVLDMNGDGLPDQVGHAKDDTWWYALNTGSGFQNHFWQRRGEVEFVVAGFRRDSPVDLSRWLPREKEDWQIKDVNASLNDQNQIVLELEEPTNISSIVVGDRNDSVRPVASGAVIEFDQWNNMGWKKKWADPELRNGNLILGLEWQPARGDLDVGITFGHQGRLYRAKLEQEAPPGSFDPLIDGGHTLGNVTIDDGQLVLNGQFDGLAGIQVTSRAGHLSLETVTVGDFEIALTNPFANGQTIVNQPQQIVVGVLGAENHLDISGTTTTSIRYSGSLEEALSGDLIIDVGLGRDSIRVAVAEEPWSPPATGATDLVVADPPTIDPTTTDPPASNPPATDPPPTEHSSDSTDTDVGPVYDRGTFSIVDGRLILRGVFGRLAGIQAQSRGGFLSLERLEVPGTDGIILKKPFSLQTGVVVVNEPTEIAMGVLGRQNHINLNGEIETAILYSGTMEDALAGDLLIQVGVDGEPQPRSLNLTV